MVAILTRGAFLKAAALASSLTISPSSPAVDFDLASGTQTGGVVGTAQPGPFPSVSSTVVGTIPSPLEDRQYAAAAAFVRREITRIVREENPSMAGSILRLSFHDATVRSVASDPSIGGADGSIRYELEWPENRGLAKPLAVVTSVYEEQLVRFSVPGSSPIEEENAPLPSCPLSFADTLALSGAAAVEAAEGPQIPVRLGRRDKEVADNRFLDRPIPGFTTMDQGPGDRASITSSLPSAGLDSLGLRNYFRRLGLTESELVALSGAHDLGRHVTLLGMRKDCLRDLTRACLEDAPVLWPFVTKDPDTLSNRYFATLLRWNKREIERGEASFIPTDVALVVDDGLKRHVVAFAKDEKLFFRRFRTAYQKLVDSTASSQSRF
ncbi:unnamed protein product [Pseudo-nitzschia multistriata]|uniref:Plant heme peroxidase family profile domain-containing protein n=1 Tax=Pseudo-nitzschia multistriata TaxID=183589 RepID=A0A448YY71_9STRA|nr:unnamed protein product [Pseudo-nitzschia multistriata]